MSKTIFKLPEHLKMYEMVMSDKSSFIISHTEKAGILKSKTQFIELRSGEVINKSFVVVMRLYKDGTRKKFFDLPLDKRQKLIDSIDDSDQYEDRLLSAYPLYRSKDE